MAQTVRLIGPSQRAHAHQLIEAAPANAVMKLAEETRSDRQNRKLHAMLGDIQRQVPDMLMFSIEDAKLRFMDALGTELRYLPKLEGQGFFPVANRTSTLTVEQFNGLIAILDQYGAAHGVRWTEPKDMATCPSGAERCQLTPP